MRRRFLVIATAVSVVLLTQSCSHDSTAPSGPAALHIAAGDGTSAPIGSVIDAAVTVVDSRGRPVAGINVIWGVTACCSTVSPQSSVTSDVGVARTSWTLGSAGDNALNAFVEGKSLSPVTLHATALASEGPADFVVTILDPRPDQIVGDSADVSVEVNTARPLSSVAASAGSGEARLTYASTSGARTFWKGRVSMQGTARSNVVLTVIAVDANGVTSKGLVTVVHDRAPTIIVHAPLNNSVAKPTFDYWVDCVDDDPAGCASLNVTAYSSDNLRGTVIATGTSTLKGTATLTDNTYVLQFGAVDSRGQIAGAQRTISVVTNPHLQELISGLGSALDYRSNRLLFSSPDSAPYRLAIRSSDGHDDLIPLDSQRIPVNGLLTSNGAAFAAQLPGMTSRTLSLWQNGSLTTIPGPYATADFIAEGDFVLYWTTVSGSLAATLRRYNVITNEDILIASSLPANIQALAPNGDVAFWRAEGDWNVYWYHGGATTPVTSDGNQSAMNIYPLTDGTQVIFIRQTPCCNVGTPMYAIEAFDGTTVAELAPPVSGPQPFPHQSYAARAGWVAFVKPDAFNVKQVWTRSPSGQLRQVSTFATPGQIVALGDDGSVIFSSASRDYFAAPGSSPVDLGSIPGRPVWRDGMFVTLIGRSAFKVVP